MNTIATSGQGKKIHEKKAKCVANHDALFGGADMERVVVLGGGSRTRKIMVAKLDKDRDRSLPNAREGRRS